MARFYRHQFLFIGLHYSADQSRREAKDVPSIHRSRLDFFFDFQVVVLTVFLSFLCMKSGKDDRDQYHDGQTQTVSTSSQSNSSTKPSLTEHEKETMRHQRLLEDKMNAIIHRTMIYGIFFIFVCFICYSNGNSQAFRQVDHLRHYFSTSITNHSIQAQTIEQFWSWISEEFIWKIRAQHWYNGNLPQYLAGFIDDKTNRLIGWPTMRQLRIRSSNCPSTKIEMFCQDDYSIQNEEQRSFEPSWINETNALVNDTALYRAFMFRSNADLDSYWYIGDHATYSGNGYVFEFRGRLKDIQSNLSELHRHQWIDERTRAVLIQLNLYNPNVQLMTSVLIVYEFLPTGGIHQHIRIEPIDFYDLIHLSQLIMSVLYFLFILYFIYVEIRSIQELKWNYLRQFWTYVEWSLIIFSWSALALFFCRHRETQRLGELFETNRGYVYVNLQLATYFHDVFIILLGFCSFLSTIRFFRLCSYHPKLSLFSETLRLAARELISFAFMFAIIFIAFVTLFYFLFVSKIASCATFLRTMTMLFEMTLFKFDATDLASASSFLGPLCFALFMILMVFICLSMFLSIINQNFQRARQNQDPERTEVVQLMKIKFLKMLGNSSYQQ